MPEPRPVALEQAEASELPKEDWDAVIAGAGPAGSLCALMLARRGRRVLLVDRHRFPRDKACGDLLIPDSLDALGRAGLAERVRRIGRSLDEAVVSSPSRIEWTISGDFVALKREDLDALVVEGAVAAGVTLARGEVIRVRPQADGVRVELRGGVEVEGRFGIVATGANVSLLEELHLVERKEPTAVAVRAYIRSDAGPDRLIISFDRSIVPGYGWIFPLPGDQFNVGVGVLFEEKAGKRPDLKKLLDRFLSSYPPARALCWAGGGNGAGRVEAVRGARLRCGIEGTGLIAGERVLAIGETVGTTYPFTGEGVGKAMESGELAAAAVDEALASGDTQRLRRYVRRVDEELRPRYVGYQLAQDWCARPLLNDLLAWRARRSPYLRRKAAEMVAEAADPRDTVSLTALLRSLWR